MADILLVALDDRGANADQVGVGGDLLEPVRPVVAAPRRNVSTKMAKVRDNRLTAVAPARM
jgi:hypothetical protein